MKNKLFIWAFLIFSATALTFSACSSSSSDSGTGAETSDECADHPDSPNCIADDESNLEEL